MKRTLVILFLLLLSIPIDNHLVTAEKLSNGYFNKYELLRVASNLDSESEQPDYKLIYDTLLTILYPLIDKEIINYYGHPKQFGLYDAKILNINRHEGQFGFITEVQVTTFVHAHNPPYGKETITFKIDPSGVKTISFQHEGDNLEKVINEFYKATLADIAESFELNIESYASYTYNQLRYQAEINNEFKTLTAIADEIVINILLPQRKIPDKNVIDPITLIKDNTGYMLFKMSDGTNVIYTLQKKDEKWEVTDRKKKQGKKMDDLIPWYVSKQIKPTE